MLKGDYQSVLEANTRDEFRGEVLRFTRRLEFETFSAITVVDHAINRSEFIAIDNCPVGYREAIESPQGGRLDPVMQHCKRSSIPIVWDQQTYLRHDMMDFWESQARFGYRTGICLALHLPEGRHFLLGVDRDQPLPKKHYQLTRVVADLQLFAVHALDTAMRVLLPAEQQLDEPKLTPRELECLHWTMEGKTAWEVGNLLGITERTAVLHLNNATRKMGSNSKHQAVLKALRMGLIR